MSVALEEPKRSAPATSAPSRSSASSAPAAVLPLLSPEQVLAQRLAEKRRQLEAEAGLDAEPAEAHRHFKKPLERFFSKAQRGHTTLLFGGLTLKHERLIKGAFEGLGYKTDIVPTPKVADFQAGKEFGNTGQCNPTYFTVGSLVNYLRRLRDERGLSTDYINDNFVFLTAGACGPCRFGMYEAEYRLALRNAGFEGFRVVLFQTNGGLNQAQAEAGLEMNMSFFLKLIDGFNLGDLLNEVGYQIRPYEINPGQTDAVMEEITQELIVLMRDTKSWDVEDSGWTRVLKGTSLEGTAASLGKFVNHITGTVFTEALRRAAAKLDRIPVDRTRPKPLVKITGEFWAQTTEGDGNFNMFPFLEREGAEVLVEPIITWLLYMIHQAKQGIRDRYGLKEGPNPPEWWNVGRQYRENKDFLLRYHRLTAAEEMLKREYKRLGEALGGTCHEPTDQYELQRLGHPFYNSRAGGGEGHLEVAKNIYYSNKDLAHMVLSLKPFGCMPSTQSDGAQSAVVNLYKDMIFLPIETSGEGEVNAHSRVQMALGEARSKCKNEFAAALESTGRSLEDIRSFVSSRPDLQRPLMHLPKIKGVVGTAARFVRYVGSVMNGKPMKVAGH
jgi:predicted nucleotide-binding protein (sugar kinase/HSP70/actin superfamily)